MWVIGPGWLFRLKCGYTFIYKWRNQSQTTTSGKDEREKMPYSISRILWSYFLFFSSSTLLYTDDKERFRYVLEKGLTTLISKKALWPGVPQNLSAATSNLAPLVPAIVSPQIKVEVAGLWQHYGIRPSSEQLLNLITHYVAKWEIRHTDMREHGLR